MAPAGSEHLRTLRTSQTLHEVIAPDLSATAMFASGDASSSSSSSGPPTFTPSMMRMSDVSSTAAGDDEEQLTPSCGMRAKEASEYMTSRLPLRPDGSMYPFCSLTPCEDVAEFSVGWAFYLSDLQRVGLAVAILALVTAPIVIWNFVNSVVTNSDVGFIGFISRSSVMYPASIAAVASGVNGTTASAAPVVTQLPRSGSLLLPPNADVPWWCIALAICSTLASVAFFASLKTLNHLRDRRLQHGLNTPAAFTIAIFGLPQVVRVDDVEQFFRVFGDVAKVCLHQRVDPALLALHRKRGIARAVVDSTAWARRSAKAAAAEECKEIDVAIKARWLDFFAREGETASISSSTEGGARLELQACFVSFTSPLGATAALRRFQGAKQLSRERNRLADDLRFWYSTLCGRCGAPPAVATWHEENESLPSALPWEHSLLRSCVEPDDVAWQHVSEQGMAAELKKCRRIRLAAAIALLGLLMLILVVLQLGFQFMSFAQHSQLFTELSVDLFDAPSALPSTGAALLQLGIGLVIGTTRFLTFAAFVPGLNGLARYWSRSHLERANFLWSAVVEFGWFISINVTTALTMIWMSSAGTDVAWASASAVGAANLEFWTVIFYVDISLFSINQLGRLPVHCKRLFALCGTKTQVQLNEAWVQPADTPYWLYKNVVKVALIAGGIGPWSPMVYFGAACELLVTFLSIRLVLTRYGETPIAYRSFIGHTASLFYLAVSGIAAASGLFFIGEATKWNVFVMLPLVLFVLLDWALCTALGWDDVREWCGRMCGKMRCACCDKVDNLRHSLWEKMRHGGRGSVTMEAPARARGQAFDAPLDDDMPPPPPSDDIAAHHRTTSSHSVVNVSANVNGKLKKDLAKSVVPVGFFEVEAKRGSFAPPGFIGEAKIYAQFSQVSHLRGRYHDAVDSVAVARKFYAADAAAIGTLRTEKAVVVGLSPRNSVEGGGGGGGSLDIELTKLRALAPVEEDFEAGI